MRQIGFKNFRKFADFPPLDLAPITILVGENNAGKSTVIKGILALSDFIKSNPVTFDFEEFDIFDFDDRISEEKIINIRRKRTKEILKNIKFSFNTSYLAHIGTFKRALYNKSESNIITFKAKIGFVDFEINILGDPKNNEAVSGNVSSVLFYFDMVGLRINYDLFNDTATMFFVPPKKVDFTEGTPDEVKEFFSNFTAPETIKMPISEYWHPDSNNILISLLSSTEDIINITLYPPTDNKYAIFSRSIRMRNALSHVNFSYANPLDLDNKQRKFLLSYCKVALGYNVSRENNIIPFRLPGGFRKSFFLKKHAVEYLYAHAVSQTVLYSAKDTNDYLSLTIHEFASLPKQTHKRKFILHWMNQFGIGKEYGISSVGGEAHIVKIKNFDDEEVNLADKGMGSIQLMVLLFRLAISLPKSKANIYKNRLIPPKTIIIIEEPEQNLHPKLQSKLADLFFYLYSEYGYRFIIETHSEYLVRRTQVITAIENKKTELAQHEWDNPFKVYYFPAEGFPYDMEYAKDGYFERSFGKGFFNVSSELSLDLDRIEQGIYDERQD